MKLSIITLIVELLLSGMPAYEIETMVCTAIAESSMNVLATNTNSNKSTDIGLYQINTIWHKTPPCDKDLFNPRNNIRCATHIYYTQGLNAWYGYKAKCNSPKKLQKTIQNYLIYTKSLD